MTIEEIIEKRNQLEAIMDSIPSWQGNYTATRNHISIAIDYLNQQIGEQSNHD
jgi:hypothetical protein